LRKLENLNGHYLREAEPARLAALVAPKIAGADEARLAEAMPFLTVRAKDLNELAEGARFLFAARPLAMDEKAAVLLEGGAREMLALLHAALSGVTEWSAEATEQAVREVAEAEGVKLGQVAQPLRAALTGRATSPGIFDVLTLLGRAESLARVADAMTGKDV
jgi:glutamyl-tRNA synthetase